MGQVYPCTGIPPAGLGMVYNHIPVYENRRPPASGGQYRGQSGAGGTAIRSQGAENPPKLSTIFDSGRAEIRNQFRCLGTRNPGGARPAKISRLSEHGKQIPTHNSRAPQSRQGCRFGIDTRTRLAMPGGAARSRINKEPPARRQSVFQVAACSIFHLFG